MQDEERIRQRAHEIWEREGRPEGRREEHWAQAIREIAAEDDSGPSPGGAAVDGAPTLAATKGAEATPAQAAAAAEAVGAKRRAAAGVSTKTGTVKKTSAPKKTTAPAPRNAPRGS